MNPAEPDTNPGEPGTDPAELRTNPAELRTIPALLRAPALSLPSPARRQRSRESRAGAGDGGMAAMGESPALGFTPVLQREEGEKANAASFRVGIPIPNGTGQDAHTPLPQNTLRKNYYNTMFK